MLSFFCNTIDAKPIHFGLRFNPFKQIMAFAMHSKSTIASSSLWRSKQLIFGSGFTTGAISAYTGKTYKEYRDNIEYDALMAKHCTILDKILNSKKPLMFNQHDELVEKD